MSIELQTMREKLNNILNDESINSEIVLSLSQELDKAILEYYQKWITSKINLQREIPILPTKVQ
jgi:hypothetical protein